MKTLFEMGQVVATPAALTFCEGNRINPLALIGRHCNGDFGELCVDDIAANIHAIDVGTRILSSYKLGNSKVWIITEADRSSTCVLMPDEY